MTDPTDYSALLRSDRLAHLATPHDVTHWSARASLRLQEPGLALLRVQPDVLQYVIENGREWTELSYATQHDPAAVGGCYAYCMRALSHETTLRYVEGLALVGPSIAIHHAWLVDEDDLVIDDVLETPAAWYYGVEIEDALQQYDAICRADGAELLDSLIVRTLRRGDALAEDPDTRAELHASVDRVMTEYGQLLGSDNTPSHVRLGAFAALVCALGHLRTAAGDEEYRRAVEAEQRADREPINDDDLGARIIAAIDPPQEDE